MRREKEKNIREGGRKRKKQNTIATRKDARTQIASADMERTGRKKKERKRKKTGIYNA